MQQIIQVKQLLHTITELFRPFKVHFPGKPTKKWLTFGESTGCFDGTVIYNLRAIDLL